jgi:hypothetical protein
MWAQELEKRIEAAKILHVLDHMKATEVDSPLRTAEKPPAERTEKY